MSETVTSSGSHADLAAQLADTRTVLRRLIEAARETSRAITTCDLALIDSARDRLNEARRGAEEVLGNS